MNNEVVLVTGAGSGFGRLIAETLARNGCQVFATMREPDARNAAAVGEIKALAQSERLALRALELDVTDEDSVLRAVDAVIDACGRIDVLVNNAGSGMVALAETVTTAQAQRLFDTNFFGAVRMNRAVLPAMKQHGSGLLLHVSSGAGRLAIPAMSIYCASKFALEALAEVYRYELAGIGIDSVVLEPGAYPTPIMTKMAEGQDSIRRVGYGAMSGVPETVLASLASSRADPQDVADCVLGIIRTPAGQRRLRYRVSPTDSGVSRINAATDEVQAQLIEAFGLTATTTFKAH